MILARCSDRARRALLVAGALLVAAAPAGAADPSFFRIGTGGEAGTYYPIGQLVAQGLSEDLASPLCKERAAAGEFDANCGVPGLLAIASISNGSVSNVGDVSDGTLEAAFAQADVVHWAYNGTEIFKGEPAKRNLRVIANLYPESLHVVARRAAGLRALDDLAGRRVSLDEPGSGTLVDAVAVLEAAGLSASDLQTEYVKPDLAGQQVRDGTLDVFFIIAGFPTRSVAELSKDDLIDLLPVSANTAARISKTHGFFVRGEIPAGIYPGIGPVETLQVGSQMIVSSQVDAETVYRVTKALWSERTGKLLSEGHPTGKVIRRDRALLGLSIPLHVGAERFYQEAGLL